MINTEIQKSKLQYRSTSCASKVQISGLTLPQFPPQSVAYIASTAPHPPLPPPIQWLHWHFWLPIIHRPACDTQNVSVMGAGDLIWLKSMGLTFYYQQIRYFKLSRHQNICEFLWALVIFSWILWQSERQIKSTIVNLGHMLDVSIGNVENML